MPFSFPSSPSIGDKSTQNSREYQWSGYAWEIVATPASLNASVITAGTLNAARLPLATTVAAGAVIVGTGLGVSSGTVSVTYGTTSGTACQGNDSRLSDARTPTSHSHGNITNAGAIGSSANLPIITTTSGVLTTGSFGTSAATFCEGNDSRLSDTRTPTDGSVTTAKIASDAVTYAKIQNVSATDRLLGRSSAGAGDVEEITCTAFGRSLIDDADAAAARSTLSVQPTASPAFTGTVTAAAVTLSGVLLVTAGSASAPGVVFSGDLDTGIAQLSAAGANTISLVTAGSERVRIDASGNVGVGNIVPTHRLDCNGELRLRGTGASTEAGKLHLYWVSSTNRATWTTDASGNALIETGVSAPAERFRVGVNGRSQFFAASEKYGVQLNNGSTANGPFIGSDGADIFTISTSGGAERVRVKATGSVRFVPLSADPSTGNEAGDVYYNSSTNKLRVYNGTSWVDLH